MAARSFVCEDIASLKVDEVYAYGKNVFDIVLKVGEYVPYHDRKAYLAGYGDAKDGRPQKYDQVGREIRSVSIG